jgi:hypothetical protein
VELVDAMSTNGQYEFHHLGSGHKRNRSVRFASVSVLDQGPMAMIEALRAHRIEAVLLWSIWPETFSFVAHEAVAADAVILTCQDSGNVARVAKMHGGLVFGSEDDLARAFGSGAVHDLIRQRRGRPRRYGVPRFSEMSFGLVPAASRHVR